MCCICSTGLFVGGPRLLLSQQVVFRHRAPLGRPVQERDHPPFVAQPGPEEGHLELHPLCFRNTVSNCLFVLLSQTLLLVIRGLKNGRVYRYDDYDYGEVNQLLGRDLKLYIKAVACFPDATKTPACPLRMASLKTSEQVRKPPLASQPCLLFFFFLTLCDSARSLSHRYTWICWSWRRGCRASCCTHWEPSLSTWLPKCLERHKAWTLHRYRETGRHEDREILTADGEVGRRQHF